MKSEFEQASLDLEKELIEQAKSGNNEAFDRLMQLSQKRVFGLAYRMLDDIEDAKDVVQETFFKAYLSLKSFRGESSFAGWVMKIATNLCISRYRKKQMMVKIEEALGIGHSHSREDEIDADVYSKALSNALKTLTPRERAVFVLRIQEENSVAQTAKVMGIAEGTVKALLHRANGKMRKALKKELPDEEF